MSATNLKIMLDGDDLSLDGFDGVIEGIKDLLGIEERAITGATRAKAEWSVVADPTFILTASPNGLVSEQLEEIASNTWLTLQATRCAIDENLRLDTVIHGKPRLEAVKKVVSHLGNGVEQVRVEVDRRDPIVLEKKSTSYGLGAAEIYYVEYSSLDGIVDLFSIREPRPFFSLRENNTQRTVKVFFSFDLFNKARDAIGRLVEVTGLVRVRQDGVPVSIRDVTDIYIYPDDGPDILSFAGTLPDLLGDLSLDEYMDRIRGRDGR